MNFKDLQMYLLSNYPFYYSLIQQCNITLDSKSEYIAYVKVNTKMEIIINPEKFQEFSISEQAGLLIHELQHLYRDHIKQTIMGQIEGISNKLGIETNHTQANVAMDIEINSNISELSKSKKLGPNADKESKYKGVFASDFKFPERDSWFNYYARLKDNPAFKKSKAKKQGHQDHEYFKKSTKDQKMLDEIVANAAKRAKSINHGSTPHEIEKYLLDYEIGKQVPWNVILRQFMQSLLDVNSKNTWKKVNRRFRGKLPGAKRLPKLELLIGIDSSGSVSDEDLKKFYAEVEAINAAGNVTIDIAVFDTNIHQREEYSKGFKAKRLCSGGTSFIPVHELALKERYKGVIYLTDGYADFPDKNEVSYKCLWVLNTSVQPPYGNVVRIK